MSDSIYRQDAIDTMWKALYTYEDLTEKQFMEHEELELEDWFQHKIFVQRMHEECMKAVESLPSAEPKTGKWIQKPHKVYLARDYVPDFNDYHDRQYNEEDHSIVEYWWHCSQCDYEADRYFKPWYNYCPICGSFNGGEEE